MKIGIVLLATNAYFVLGIRFVKRFMQFYKGDKQIKFYIFTDTNPQEYLPDNIDYEYIYTTNKSWVDGTNLKFTSILQLEDCSADFLAYFDADTSVNQDFTEEWFLGDLVGGQHYADKVKGWMLEKKGFERNPRSKAYIPIDTPLPQMYYYGAFFSAKKDKMMEFCKELLWGQVEDKKWGYEACVNDESHIQRYFHYNPPTKTVLCTEFKFVISHKGGLPDTRNMKLDVSEIKKDLLQYKNEFIDIEYGKVTCINRSL
jgi:hypothetical protein